MTLFVAWLQDKTCRSRQKLECFLVIQHFNLILLNIFNYRLVVDFVLEAPNFSFELGNYVLILRHVEGDVQDISVHLIFDTY